MPLVVGVKFKDSGKIYHFDPNQHHLELGDAVVVETVRGLELGKVAAPIEDLPDSDLIAELKPVIRQPTTEDYDRMRVLAERRDDVLRICAERISVHRLPMRLIRSDWNFDGTRLTIYFTSQQRVDFRHLVRELARIFHARIELRQIGARDEAKLLGGLGPCGRPLCCSTFLPDFARVSVKMAKDQDLPLNPSKISGVCGRLLCCLSYEQEQYLEIKAELPTRGEQVKTPEGIGYVVAVNTIRETVTVDIESNYHDFKADQLETLTGAAGAIARERLEQGEAAPIAQKRFNRPVGETIKSTLNNWDNEDWGLDELRSFEEDPESSGDKPKPRPKPAQQARPNPEAREQRTNPNEQRPRFDRAERQKRFNRSEAANAEASVAPTPSNEPSERKPRHAFKRKGDTTPTPERPKLPATVRQQSLGGVPEQLTPRGRQPSTNDPDEPKQPNRRRRRGNGGNGNQQGQQQVQPKPNQPQVTSSKPSTVEKTESESAKPEANNERRSPRRRKRRS